MARNQSRSSNIVYGICTNTSGKEDGTPCSKCQSKEKQAIRASKEFVCEECGEPLKKVEVKQPNRMLPIIIAAAVVVVGGGIGAGLGISNSNKKKAAARAEALRIEDSIRQVREAEELAAAAAAADSAAQAVVLSVTVGNIAYDLTVGDSDSLKAEVQPAGADATITYTSSNENVAMVTSNGLIHAIGEGEADITVVATPVTGKADTARAKVTVKKKKAATTGSGAGSTNIGFGKYSGPMKGGKPHGVGGTVTVTSNYSIDLKDGRGSKLDVVPGDTIVNTKFENGVLRAGELHRKDGTRKWFNC